MGRTNDHKKALKCFPTTSLFFPNFQKTVAATKLQRNICFYDGLNQKYKVQHDVFLARISNIALSKGCFGGLTGQGP